MPIAAPPAVALTTTVQTLHTVPAGVRQFAEVIVATSNTTTPATITLSWTDASAANASMLLVQTDIAAKDGILTPRKVLEAGDKLTASASANGFLTASVNVTYEEPA